ncbi:pyruvate kinase [Candidatus Pelagibacter sp.]|nr:pyruvate kinase [Candidatus Pelagibacter sp.]
MLPKIIATLGPSSYKKKVIKELVKTGVYLFRINLSHTKTKDLEKIIKYLKKNGIKNICIDTEGAQIRTTMVQKKSKIQKNQIVKIFCGNKNSNNKEIYLYPNFDLSNIKIGKEIKIGFDELVMKILKFQKDKKFLICKVINSGILDSNKGVHIDIDTKLNYLTSKDLECIGIAKKNKIKFFALSFTNYPSDVVNLRNILDRNSTIISKIETRKAIRNLDTITKQSNAILIDRGDLSRYISLDKIPYAQEYIINVAKKLKKPVYIATNLLETMIQNSSPTRAECNDIYNALNQGASALVLAAETAIGKNPLNTILFLKKSIATFNVYKKKKINFN